MPRIKEVTVYQVVDDFGSVDKEFRDRDDAEDYLNDWLLQIQQVEESEVYGY